MNKTWSKRELYLKMSQPRFYGPRLETIFRELGCDRDRKVSASARKNWPQVRCSVVAREGAIVEPTLQHASPTSPEKPTSSLDDKSPEEVLYILEGMRAHTKVSNSVLKDSTLSTGGERLVLCLSDIHYGSLVKNGMTGQETYSPEITERWIREIPRKILEVCPGDSYSYSGIDIILAGDLVDGEEIYPTHARHLQLSVIDQTKGLVKALWQLTKELQRLFGDARIVSVRGNHGRMSQSADERSNWDNMIYQQLALLVEMEGDATLRMECSHGEFCNFETNGWKGHVRHVAIPHDGTAAVRNKIGSWKQMHGFDFLICGHYHNCGILNYNDTMIIRNGAMMPQNDYAERLALGGSPRQIIFGVSTDHLPTFISYLTWKQN